MRGGHGAHVETLSIRGQSAMKSAAIIGRDPEAKITPGFLDDGVNRRKVDRTSGNCDRRRGLIERSKLRGKVRIRHILRGKCASIDVSVSTGCDQARSAGNQQYWADLGPLRATTRARRVCLFLSHTHAIYRSRRCGCKSPMDKLRISGDQRHWKARSCALQGERVPARAPTTKCRRDASQILRLSIARKANGAGIAADPTLTGAWALYLAVRSANLSFRVPERTWRPMSHLHRSGGFRHRRSHRHPTSACEQSLRLWAQVPLSLHLLLGQGRDHFSFRQFSQTGIQGFRLSYPQALARSVAIRWMSFAISSGDPACYWPKPLACRLSKFARTTSIASIGLEILSKSECYHSILKSFLALSMIRDCALRPSRASLATPSFPLLPRSSVDDGG